MPSSTSPGAKALEFVPGQFYFGETEIEIGGMEIRVQYHFLPKDPEEFPYSPFEAQEVHFKDVHLKHTKVKRIAGLDPSERLEGQKVEVELTTEWIDVKDLLEETNGDLGDLLQAKFDELLVEYRPNDRPVDE